MLWNIVYNFFIKYIFGGTSFEMINDNYVLVNHDSLFTAFNYDGSTGAYQLYNVDITLFGRSMHLGNYLSFIATIITMVAIVLICCALIKKIYNMCAHIIG